MGEDYYSMNREELIEKLKSKDEQIKGMTDQYEKWKNDFKYMFEKELTEQKNKYTALENDFKKYKRETEELRTINFENEHLKDAIVAMAMYCFPGISNIDKNIIDIKEYLRNISKGR